MPNQRACLPCKNEKVAKYLKERMALGASLRTISAELAQSHRLETFGYRKAPGTMMLETHVNKHMVPLVPVLSTSDPVFAAAPKAPEFKKEMDIAALVQQQAYEQMQRGEMRISAAHALRAQEILDRRAERQADREMQVALARIVLSRRNPPQRLVGGSDDIVEGEAVEVEAGSTAP